MRVALVILVNYNICFKNPQKPKKNQHLDKEICDLSL